MPSGYNSRALVFLCVTTFCSLVEGAEISPDKWWYFVITPLVIILGIVILLLTWYLRKKCSRPVDAAFIKMVSSASSASWCSQNSTFRPVALNADRDIYEGPTEGTDEILTIDLCNKAESEGINGIQHFVNPVLTENQLDEGSSPREIPLTPPYSARYPSNGKRHSLETTKVDSDSLETEFTLHNLKTSALDFSANGLGKGTCTVLVHTNNSIKMETAEINSTALISRFKSRTISATSDSDYCDLDDDEVQRSILKEENCSSLSTADSLFTSDLEFSTSFSMTQVLKRPLPEITQPLHIVMENDIYSSI